MQINLKVCNLMSLKCNRKIKALNEMPTFGLAQQQCKKRENGKFEGRVFRLVMILLIAISF